MEICLMRTSTVAIVASLLLPNAALAEENYEAWEKLQSTFPSTAATA